MSEWLEVKSVEMWLVEASQHKIGSAKYEEWVDYAKVELMNWLGFAMNHYIVGYNMKKLREILYLDNNPKFNKWAKLYCETLERYLTED